MKRKSASLIGLALLILAVVVRSLVTCHAFLQQHGPLTDSVHRSHDTAGRSTGSAAPAPVTPDGTPPRRLARVFERWPAASPFPCYPPPSSSADDPEQYRRGIQYIKLPKCASSTSAGISLRIAHRHGPPGRPCRVTFNHEKARERHYGRRDRTRSFLWTVIRDPTARAVSAFYHFRIGRTHGAHGTAPGPAAADALLRAHLARSTPRYVPGGTMLNYLTTTKLPAATVADMYDPSFTRVRNATAFDDVVARVLDDYDLIGTVERLDESLVLLGMLLGLDAGDLLYLSAKTNGGYDDGLGGGDRCALIPTTYVSAETRELFDTEQWRTFTYGDEVLYGAVDRSLDATIEAVGKTLFRSKLAEHRRRLQVAQQRCGDVAVFPCSKTGVKQVAKSRKNCYVTDSGCGYPCLDKLSNEWNRNKKQGTPK